ncbi:MAG: N-formylglutamate amidohydrolase [Acidimicrobiia bacterium]
MGGAGPDWIPEGAAFGVDEMVFYAGQPERTLDDALATVDLIVTGPHASAAFPAEVRPFVDERLTQRLQYDFTDVSTSPVARRWAERDPRVLYVENPHPRAVRDANRARPDDLRARLQEAFRRIVDAGEGGRPALDGVDAVRPVTFGYVPVLRPPSTGAEWDALVDALVAAGRNGVDVYESVRDELISRAVAAKLARLATLDLGSLAPAERTSATTLLVLSLHDTMNRTARPDGAICVERAPADRLPAVVALSNRGGPDGAVRPSATGELLAEVDVPTLDAPTLRAVADSYRWAFDAHDADDVAFNRPYLGGYETQRAGPALRALAPRAVVATADGATAALRLGAWQDEFRREFLLGPEATEALTVPGETWHGPPDDRVAHLAERLAAAHDHFLAHAPAP